MEKCRSDGEVGVRCTLLACLWIQLCSRPDKTAGSIRRIPIPEIQAMVVCKNCLWRVVGGSVG